MKNHCFTSLLFAISISFAQTSQAADCDLTEYQKITAACMTGRAEGFGLPDSNEFGMGGGFNSSWNQGPFDGQYKGPDFLPHGEEINMARSILPPYSWGAVGQECDQQYNSATHAECVNKVNQALYSPQKNALILDSRQFYWKAHGHNCHDAAEDVGTCFNNAAAYQKKECRLKSRVIVWDSVFNAHNPFGNVYHSQLLVLQKRQTPNSKKQESVVCLEESQIYNPAGTAEDSCCSTNLSLFKGAPMADYVAAFQQCPFLFFKESYMHPDLYEVNKFREKRKTGIMDVANSYDRLAGVKSLFAPPSRKLGGLPPQPKSVSKAYDADGVAIMLNVR